MTFWFKIWAGWEALGKKGSKLGKQGLHTFVWRILETSQSRAPNSTRGQPRRGLCRRAAGPGTLTAMHCLMMQDCFILPGPPNFFMSLQKWHSPHSVRRHASHLRHRVLRRRAPAVLRLAASFTAEAAPSFPLGRPTALFWKRNTHNTQGQLHSPAPCWDLWGELNGVIGIIHG